MPDDPKKGKEITNEQLAQAMGLMAKGIQEMGANLPAQISKSVAEHLKVAKPPTDQDPAPPKNTGDDQPFDIDSLSRTDFARYIVKAVSDGLIKPQAENLDQANQEIAKMGFQKELDSARGSHKDLDSFMKGDSGIASILKNHATLSVEDAYSLARVQNPDLVKKLDEEELKDNPPQDGPAEWLGLLPTSIRPRASGEEKKEGMEPKQAAESAWDSLGLDNLHIPGYVAD